MDYDNRTAERVRDEVNRGYLFWQIRDHLGFTNMQLHQWLAALSIQLTLRPQKIKGERRFNVGNTVKNYLNPCIGCHALTPARKPTDKVACDECCAKYYPKLEDAWAIGGTTKTRRLVLIRDHLTCRVCGKVYPKPSPELRLKRILGNLGIIRDARRRYPKVASMDTLVMACRGCDVSNGVTGGVDVIQRRLGQILVNGVIVK